MNSVDLTSTVLSNDLVFDCICNFLSLEDLKQFRLVSRNWKDISEAAFKKRVRICFDFDHNNRSPLPVCIKYNPSSLTQSPAPEDLNAFFRTSQMTEMTRPFTAIRFSNKLPWSNSALTEFFATEGKCITDLVLHEVTLKNEDDTANIHQSIKVRRRFKLMSIFGGILSLEKLRVECYGDFSTRFTLTFHDLARIQYINLKYCIVKVTDCRITPIELEFRDLRFMQDRKRLDSVLLNDFVNFTLMEKLMTEWTRKTTKIKLNLFGSEKVKFVQMVQFDLPNEVFYDTVDFTNSSWEIETLDLRSFPFQQMNNMMIGDLCIDCIPFSPHNFPQSLQKLQLCEDVIFPENLTWNFSLPKLKILDLTGEDTVSRVFPHLINSFGNLVELKFKSDPNGPTAEIDVTLIPPHVKKILFHGTSFDFVNDGVRTVETVFLTHTNLEFALKVCNHFVLNNLVVFVPNNELKVGVDQSLFIVLSTICHQGIILGMFDWKNTGNNCDDFVLPSVDKPGEFYSYINARGDFIKCQHGARNKSPLKFIQLISQRAEFQ